MYTLEGDQMLDHEQGVGDVWPEEEEAAGSGSRRVLSGIHLPKLSPSSNTTSSWDWMTHIKVSAN